MIILCLLLKHFILELFHIVWSRRHSKMPSPQKGKNNTGFPAPVQMEHGSRVMAEEFPAGAWEHGHFPGTQFPHFC